MNKLTKIELRQLCQLARNAAIEAGIYIQSKFNSHYSRSQKQGGDTIASQVLTEVDLKAQQIILSQLQNSIDDYNLGLLTEEIAAS
ncbi:MAG: inositol monophosphatase, partial [Bacteroidota bacterium]